MLSGYDKRNKLEMALILIGLGAKSYKGIVLALNLESAQSAVSENHTGNRTHDHAREAFPLQSLPSGPAPEANESGRREYRRQTSPHSGNLADSLAERQEGNDFFQNRPLPEFPIWVMGPDG